MTSQYETISSVVYDSIKRNEAVSPAKLVPRLRGRGIRGRTYRPFYLFDVAAISSAFKSLVRRGKLVKIAPATYCRANSSTEFRLETLPRTAQRRRDLQVPKELWAIRRNERAAQAAYDLAPTPTNLNILRRAKAKANAARRGEI
jgi:hypothetical protein